MAQAVTSDNSVLAILKEYYGVQDVAALVFRNSPVLGRIKKERIGGKYIPLPMATYGSGAVTSDYTQVTQQAANSYSAVSMQVTPGRLFSSFVLDPEEFLASQGDRAAFISVFALRAMLAMDDMRKVLASALYNSGYLELGLVRAVDTSYLYVDVDPSTAMCIDPGTQILFASSLTGAYRGGTVATGPAVTVSTIANQTSGYVRVTFSTTYPTAVAVGDYVMIKGGRDASGNPNAPIGLGGWLPSGAGRTTALATSFFGVTRSSAPDRLGGNYIQRTANETYTDALIRAMKQTRRGGGVPTLIVVNDDDFGVIAKDALANRVYWQPSMGAEGIGETGATQGISQLAMTFSTSWIKYVVDDPYCTKGIAYILDEESIRLFGISNVEPITAKDLPINNEPGGPKTTDEGEPTTNFQFLVNDMYTTTPVALASGPGLRVDFQMYGQFAVLNPAHNAAVNFTPA